MYLNISDVQNSTKAVRELSVHELKLLNYPIWAHQIVGFILLIIGICGFTENILVLYTFYKNKNLRSPTNIFIIGLAIGDFSMATFGNPLASTSALNGAWFAGEFFCYWEGFVVYFLGSSQLYVMVAIAVDRYIVIAKPLKASMITKRVAALSVVVCYFGGLFWAVCPFLGWSSYGLEGAGVFCGLLWEDKSISNMTYIVMIALFDFLVPMGVMIFCYYNVYMTVANVNKNMVWDMKSRVARKNLKLERKMLKSCAIMCGVYWCCWFPYTIVSLWQAFGNADLVPVWLMAVPAAAAKSEVMWNPIIYVATNKQFRQAFYKTLPCTGLRDMLVKREEVKEASSKESNISEKENEQKNTNQNANRNAVAPTADPGPIKVEC